MNKKLTLRLIYICNIIVIMYNSNYKQGDVMFKKLAQKLKAENSTNSCFPMSSPINSDSKASKKTFLNTWSKHALDLYERKTDIKNFTKLAISDMENDSHNQIVDKLFSSGKVIDPFDEKNLFDLSDNERFLKDLGL